MQPASELVKESWFKEAISERPDLFLIGKWLEGPLVQFGLSDITLSAQSDTCLPAIPASTPSFMPSENYIPMFLCRSSLEPQRSVPLKVLIPRSPRNSLNFGGHQHIRDCIQLDGRSMTLASGRWVPFSR